MQKDTTVPFVNPAFRDELSELLRAGAQRIIRQAVEAELRDFLEEHPVARDTQGRRALVRNGYLRRRNQRRDGSVQPPLHYWKHQTKGVEPLA